MTKTSTKPEQKRIFNGLTFTTSMIGYNYNKDKKKRKKL